ncbi:MAG TPA: hypothetical protein VNH46_00625 [Gemmatimonadales bacterium]|nr:hypothetical protein [Gemmatimonadales bacterium]
METRTLSLPLQGFGSPAATATATVETLDAGERLKRAGTLMGAGLAGAVLTLPIPIVHLFFPITSLVAGIVLGIRRLGQHEMFQKVEGTCPFCGTRQRLSLTGSVFRLPRDLTCSHCRRTLTLGHG